MEKSNKSRVLTPIMGVQLEQPPHSSCSAGNVGPDLPHDTLITTGCLLVKGTQCGDVCFQTLCIPYDEALQKSKS